MSEVSIDTLLVARKIDCIQTSAGTVIRRGCTTLFVEGSEHCDGISDALQQLSESAASIRELSQHFRPDQVTVATSLIRRLLDLNLIHPKDGNGTDSTVEVDHEPATEIFYWDMNTTRDQVAEKVRKTSITIVGSNPITRLVADLTAGWECKEHFFVEDSSLSDEEKIVVDRSDLKVVDWAEQSGGQGMVVAASMDGSVDRLLYWNDQCRASGKTYVPILFNDLTAKIGPVYRPAEGGPCYKCFVDRQRSAIDLDTIKSAIFADSSGFRRRTMSNNSLVSNFVAAVASSMIETEVSGYLGTGGGTVVDVRPLIPTVTNRKVLKTPRCPVCSSYSKRPQLNEIQ